MSAATAADAPTVSTLADWMREKLSQGSTEEMVQGVVQLFDAMAEQHARVLLRFKQELRQRYGRRSEQISDDQLDLLFELFQEQVAEADTLELSGAQAELDEAQPKGKRSEKSERRRRRAESSAWPQALPRETVTVPVPEGEVRCERCGGTREVVGYDESEVLEYVPASFRVRRIRREKRACGRCRDTVVRAPAPPRVVERGRLGAGLVAQILVSKYLEHTPLYRQQQIYKRCRVSLPRSTLGDAVAAASELLQPLVRRIRERAFAQDILATDDTGLVVLDKNSSKGSRRGVLWPYVAGHRWAYFAYSPSREWRWPQEELKEYRGYLQVDGFQGYEDLFAGEGCPRTEVGCMMHARRYFVRAVDGGDLRALPAVAQIRALYRVERKAKEQGLDPEARSELREAAARPLLEEFAKWLEEMEGRATPKSPLGQAIAYTRSRWEALNRYLEDGRLEIDNGEVERLIRIVALGRKNYMFAGSDAGAERAAIAYTVLATCALHEVDPWAYVKDVLEKIAAGWPQREIDRLLPDRWGEEHPAALRRNPPA